MNAQVLGISVDSIPCLEAWSESLGKITYPLVSDFWPHGEVAAKYGVFREDGITERAIFVIDKEGVIQFIDIHDIGNQPRNEEIYNLLCQIDPDNEGKYKPAEESSALPKGGIVMYCTSWCPDCKRARKFLEANKLNYKEVDIQRNPNAAAQVREWANGNETTPTFDIDGEIIVEYDEAALKRVLKLK